MRAKRSYRNEPCAFCGGIEPKPMYELHPIDGSYMTACVSCFSKVETLFVWDRCTFEIMEAAKA